MHRIRKPDLFLSSRLSMISAVRPRTQVPAAAAVAPKRVPVRFCCSTVNSTTQSERHDSKKLAENVQTVKHLESLLYPIHDTSASSFPYRFMPATPAKLGKKWMEYQGVRNWDGLLDPLDDNLRREILRYGQFVEATYKSFDFDPSSPSYGTCLFPRRSLLERAGLPETGYRLTRNLRVTSGIQLPCWMERAPNWVATQSSWIGYVAVCQDKGEISRLGRRDVVIAYRGTATCLEWLENLRATLTHLPGAGSDDVGSCGPMVESGFLSLYTSGTAGSPSLQHMVRQEISRLMQAYGDEPLSLTITGHSLGAALATLTAYDIKTTMERAPELVTVISFGGPRVGNLRFRQLLEKQGTKVLRIVNSEDVITKLPGFVINDSNDEVPYNHSIHVAAGLPSWIQKRVEETQLMYAEVGRELRLSSRDSPYLSSFNVATCHELKTYLHLVDSFVSSACPFKANL
ncbi:phospholipase A(1) DAD1, chloroplastic-like [Juglans microcarpa x Juglans regia]|uniref:phospholipase A(1) DAD1, chloroplastic-like n=1 Tax=Juglans microcarpa x Juglans regia TaxID=2249226 RepID=UPI001B7EBD98|nr:phospholipase A(1) DAD1, chloroplastic-like [Juglans microcarpa x Juglans regia]